MSAIEWLSIDRIQEVPPTIKEAFSILFVDSRVPLSFIQIKSISDTWSAFGGMTRDKSQFKVSPFANPLNKRNNFGNHNYHRRRSRRSRSHFYQFPSNRDFTFWNSYFDSFSSQIHKLFGKLKLGKNLPRNIRNRKFLPFLPRRSLCRPVLSFPSCATLLSLRRQGRMRADVELLLECVWVGGHRKQELEMELNSFYIYEWYNLSFMDW